MRAVKAIKKSCVKDSSLIKSEIDIHSTAEHPNIAKLYEIFEDDEHFYLILELCAGGEIFYRVVEEGSFNEKVCAIVLQQMLRTLNYLHTAGVIFRDMKPENWLLLDKGNLADTSLKL